MKITTPKRRFKKGQEVFQVCPHFSTNDIAYFTARRMGETIQRLTEMRVVSRTVDTCGAKQMTFEDHGLDGVFGRSVSAQDTRFFDTADEAFAFLRSFEQANARENHAFVIYPTVVSDREWINPTI
jgi:hypothetical protein